jgi:hypothetical protein
MPKLPPKYRVSLKLPNKTYTKIRPTIVEALEDIFSMEPEGYYKVKCIVAVAYQKLRAEISIPPVYVRKLFVNGLTRQLLQKRLLNALK